MKRIGFTHLACTAVLSVLLAGAAFATPIINGASIEARTFNDCPLSTLTTTNNYNNSVEITDEMHPACVGFANLHSFSLSSNGGASAAEFNNNSNFSLAADFTISGAGTGEGGLRISPWWSQYVDGRFMANATSGEIACFGGRIPFYSFTAGHGITYIKGTTIRMQVTYRANGLSESDPATIQYRVIQNGITYDSPVLNFDMGNPAEDPPNGLWGMLNFGRVGGYFQPRANTGAALTANWSNIVYHILDTPAPNAATIETRTFNDCPLSTLVTTNSYPGEVKISDTMSPLCVGFANLHSWSFSEDGGATQAVFQNGSQFSFAADVTIAGDGTGEGGLRLAPWWSPNVDGRFMINATSGEIACFGGRLPFYTFTGGHGITYTKGTTVRMGITYRRNDMNADAPATIQYSLTQGGVTYSSPVLAYDQGNENEDPPYDLWGNLNNGRAGGYFQARANTGAELSCTWGNITFSECTAQVAFDLNPESLNLNGHGQWVTATLEPSDPFAPADIDVSSLRINGSVAVDAAGPVSIGDADGDGIADLSVKFPRADVAALLSPGNQVEVSITGSIGSDCFASSDVIKAKAKTLPAPTAAVLAPGSQVDVEWEKEGDANTVDVIASYDNGQTWGIEAQNVNNNGRYRWTVPVLYAAHARIAVVQLLSSSGGDVVASEEYGESGDFAIQSTTGVGDEDIAFALRAVQPNPSKGVFNVSFNLPTNKPARLAVYDVSGREVASRDVAGTAGRHSMAFGTRERLRPGVYMVTLNHENRKLSRRVVVIE